MTDTARSPGETVRLEAVERVADAISFGSATPFTRGLARGLVGRIMYDEPTRSAIVALIHNGGPT